MGEIIRGEYVSDEESAIIDSMMADAKEVFGDDLNDSQTAAIRFFYIPPARRIAEAQKNIGLVLESAQLENAEGAALDFLTSLIGVPRIQPSRATGEVTVSVSSIDSVDHSVPKGTTVSTNNFDPVEFETTESGRIPAGSESVTVPIRAVEGGSEANVGKNTIINFPNGSPFPGAEVTNANGTEGGDDVEGDENLRQRAQRELAEGSRSTAPSLVSRVRGIEGVFDVTIFINDTENDNGRGHGLPSHSFEIIVATDGNDDTLKEVSQTLLETKAAGDISVAGQNGDQLDTNKSFVTASGEIESDIGNGQTHPVGFSLSTSVYVWVDVDIQTTEEYEGDTTLRDSIVEYLGGIKTNGIEKDGELSVSDDVIHAEVAGKVMDIDGVHDINSVYIGKASSPTSGSNLSINAHEQALTDASEGNQHITITKS
jgi:hypothetical protein